MESSINVLKGYAKVDSNLESQNPIPNPNPSTKPKTILVIFAILFLTLVVSLMLAALIHESTSESDDSPFLSSSNSSEVIKTVCNVTRFPDSCFTSISSLHASVKPDPQVIFNLSLQVSVKEVKKVSSLLRSLNGGNSQAAINDCITQFDDSLSLLDESLSAMEVASGEKALTLKKINDIQTWVSAAMTNQQTCLDGLEEMGSTVLDVVKVKMENSKEFLSNNLAILANMQSLLEKFDLKMH